ncbi:MAG: hypothetical protein A2559_10685, partial [Deltaproteobacteria bacterium RIFOXYD2_FULL_66_9]
MRRTRLFLATGAAIILLFSSGCSEKLSRQTGLTDAGLFARGQKQAERKKHKAASETYQVLLERFPTSPLAAQAQFGLASGRMANRDEAEAEVAFDDFLRLYPADPKVPDALFMKGTLLSRQSLPPGRDQGKTLEAIKAYTLFLEREPASPRAQQASGKIRELRNRLALHEANVVDHFLTRKRFDSAEARARRAVAAYP